MNNNFLFGNLSKIIPSSMTSFNSTTLLFDILAQEIDWSVSIDRSNEGNKLKIELFCREWEQKWAILKDLL